MKYERLTRRDWAKNTYAVPSYKRLAELEDKIEQGKLIELPCMMKDSFGDWIVYFYSDEYHAIDCYDYSNKAEAEAKLKELKGE